MKPADIAEMNRLSRMTPRERSDEMLGLILEALMPDLCKPNIRQQDEPHPVTDGLEDDDD